jgi:hypothetical protein
VDEFEDDEDGVSVRSHGGGESDDYADGADTGSKSPGTGAGAESVVNKQGSARPFHGDGAVEKAKSATGKEGSSKADEKKKEKKSSSGDLRQPSKISSPDEYEDEAGNADDAQVCAPYFTYHSGTSLSHCLSYTHYLCAFYLYVSEGETSNFKIDWGQ